MLAEEFVTSSWIEELIWDDPDVIMVLLDGRSYRITNFDDEEMYLQWLDAPSKGKFYHEYVRGMYTLLHEGTLMVEDNKKPTPNYRRDDIDYEEKKLKGVVNKVIATLKGTQSGKFTPIIKQIDTIGKQIKELQAKDKELKHKLRGKVVEIFDAKDETYTRVVETVSATLTLAKKSDDKETFNKAKYVADLEKRTGKTLADIAGIEVKDGEKAPSMSEIQNILLEKEIKKLEEAAKMNNMALAKLRKVYTKVTKASEPAVTTTIKEDDMDMTEIEDLLADVDAINDVYDDLMHGV